MRSRSWPARRIRANSGILGTQERRPAGRLIFDLEVGLSRLGSLGRQRFDAGVQAALVAGGGVVVQDALLDTLVERRGGQAELLLSGLQVTLGDGLAQAAQAAAHAAPVGTVHYGLLFGLTGALERRNMVRHLENPYLILKWDAG